MNKYEIMDNQGFIMVVYADSLQEALKQVREAQELLLQLNSVGKQDTQLPQHFRFCIKEDNITWDTQN